MSFEEQKFLILVKSSYQLFLWIMSLVLYLKCSCYTQDHISFLLSSESFIVLLTHFELDFGKDVRSVSRFIFLHVDAQLFQYRLLRTLLSSTVLPLLLCQRLVNSILKGLFLDSLFCSIGLCPFVPLLHCFHDCSTVV